eukprot:CAMPEP_0197541686 /NCGR_PEP_ID=MMETSP1318-20131121/67297_1 /TAXON_ID=552666 /ORGANISM="Partenskyella glossopodia, Strain RCC365" /LENGTH=125 /DNA_ID=CAMNT_0043100887 /DNA_START=167 /DNA_END=544 /DNA_ORIENTATION=-
MAVAEYKRKTGQLKLQTGIAEYNKGYQMLTRLGWDEKSGLGMKGKEGRTSPVPTQLRLTRLGWDEKSGLGMKGKEGRTSPVPTQLSFASIDTSIEHHQLLKKKTKHNPPQGARGKELEQSNPNPK